MLWREYQSSRPPHGLRMALRRAAPWLLAAAFWLLPARTVAAEASELPEYELKAGFIYNFAKFIQWPATRFATPEAPLIIGVLGENPFGSALRDTVDGKKVNQRPIAVRQVASSNEIDACHVLFIARSEATRLAATLDGLRQRSILTVGDMERFGQRGGMINLILVGKSVRFEINVPETEAASLKINSKLGSLGIPVKTDPAQKGGAP